jgi:mannosyltransferase OCH1-like enzyme
MIPKKIHYCWFGKKEKPQIFVQCLASWKKHCPNFEIMEWNEKNSFQFSNSFYKNALRKKKYAFVSDYIRLKVLHEYGGIYLDTDMLLVKPIDNLLQYSFFSGYEVEKRVNYAFFGGVKGNHFFEVMLLFYGNTEFNEFSLPVITHTFKNTVTLTNLRENEVLFSSEYFYPLTFQNREKDYELFTTEKTYGVHLWDHSWKEEKSENSIELLKKVKIVLVDFIFYGYSKKYLRRYLKEFLRKIYLRQKNRFK